MGCQIVEAVKKFSRYKLIFSGLFLILFLLFFIKEGRTFLCNVNNPDRLKEWLGLYGPFSMVAYVIVQTLVMVLTPVPSEVLLITGGYLYGTIAGTICSMLIICSGTIVAFGLARHFGLPFIKTLVPVKYWEKFQCIQQNPFIEGILFMLFFDTRFTQRRSYLYRRLHDNPRFKVIPIYLNCQNT